MEIINIGILAHVDAGKTTLTEGLLVHSGIKRRMGRVDTGTATTDSMPLEKQRGLTIRASTVSFPWNGVKVNLIDTPGHMDFIAEVERSLSVLDGVVLVVSAREGVQQQTRVLFEKLKAMRIPTIFFINKIDRTGASCEGTLAEIARRLTPHVLPLQAATVLPGEEPVIRPLSLAEGPLHEAIVEMDESLLAEYLVGKPIPEATCQTVLAERVRACAVYPALFGSALRDIGVAPVLDAVTTFFHGSGDAEAPLSAHIYKVEWDEHGRKRHTARVFAGRLAVRDWVPIAGGEERIQVKGLLAAQGGKYTPAESLTAGDIGVILDAPGLRVGDYLGEITPPPGGITPTPPLLEATVAPLSPAERPALLTALERLVEEDPSLQLRIVPATGEISLRLYGPLQQEILSALLLERFALHAAFSTPQPIYKETPSATCTAEIRLNAPGNLLRAGIALRIEPLPPGTGNQYETLVSYGDLTRSFQTGVADGVAAGLLQGLGCAITDARVLFTDMDYCSVTSTPADFRRLAPEVLQKALGPCPRTRLEPWLAYSASIPEGHTGRVIPALVKSGASPEEVEPLGTECRLTGHIALEKARTVSLELPGMTQGRGVFVTSFAGYRAVT